MGETLKFNSEPFVSVCVYGCVYFLPPKVSLLFDNDGTVFFAMVMAVWGEFASLCGRRCYIRSYRSQFDGQDFTNEMNKEAGQQLRCPCIQMFLAAPSLPSWMYFCVSCSSACCLFILRRALPKRCHITEQHKPTCPFYPRLHRPRPSGYGGGQPLVHMRTVKV